MANVITLNSKSHKYLFAFHQIQNIILIAKFIIFTNIIVKTFDYKKYWVLFSFLVRQLKATQSRQKKIVQLFQKIRNIRTPIFKISSSLLIIDIFAVKAFVIAMFQFTCFKKNVPGLKNCNVILKIKNFKISYELITCFTFICRCPLLASLLRFTSKNLFKLNFISITQQLTCLAKQNHHKKFYHLWYFQCHRGIKNTLFFQIQFHQFSKMCTLQKYHIFSPY
eukprot:TRINITY_DN10466_c0_g2_i1.p2 TRINITY_DN10466_c0_g2~~TRINITY_DN10466_c0_g2_i1.p2  ORF type:complete len:223 (+),score=-22.89 TRINITY_DN10466_c0_g2_i1:543-1211(+)